MPCITDIPVDVILDNLFSVIPVPDLLRLGLTNRFFATLLTDELFWKRKVQEDFNFPSMDTARDDNWRLIYRGLTNPQTFVWGCVLFDYYQIGLPTL
jgi:SCF-associated factor 1